MIADGVSGVLLASLEGSPYHRLWSLGASHLALEDRTLAPCCSLSRGWKLFPAFQLWFSLRNVGFSQDALLCFSFKLQNSFLGPRVLCYALGLFCLFFKIVPLRFFFLFFFPSPPHVFLGVSWTFDIWPLALCGFLMHGASKDKRYHETIFGIILCGVSLYDVGWSIPN